MKGGDLMGIIVSMATWAWAAILGSAGAVAGGSAAYYIEKKKKNEKPKEEAPAAM